MRRRARWLKREREEAERVKDRDLFKIVDEVFDSITLGHLYRLYSRKVLRELKGSISSGKESKVFWGVSWDGSDVAVKIYLSFTSDFRKSIKKYILGDPRFEEIPSSNIRRLIYEWARKEYRNLKRMREAGVRVPKPMAVEANIVVMEFLGEKGYRAPSLAEARAALDKDEADRIARAVLDQLELIVCRARLVHADLSEYNILLWRGEPWIIDVSQAVPVDHPNAREFLERDVRNIYRFLEGIAEIGVDEDRLLEELESCAGVA
ncbi:MAG: serine protein kinase RIO [Aeropyrum sp.]|nr:serine protein kinase RIO [Aeropyrum sp.]MCE4615783.1 serine protein kinase RIO [Aeropyrum sp.]